METVRLAAQAMGTRFEAVLVGDDAGFLRAAAEEALELIEDEHARLSRFERDSVVSRVNRHASSGWVGVDGDFDSLLSLCDELVHATDGAFDPTVTSEAGACWGEVQRESGRVRFLREGVRLDFGAVAKGWALDLAREALLEAGVEIALLHGGTSSVLALGAPPGEEGWRIALGSEEGASCLLRGAALGVSAPDGEAGGEGHVLVPGTGAAANEVSLAAVVCESAAWADAWSTALVVLGETLEPCNGMETAFLLSGEVLDCSVGWRGDYGGAFRLP